MSEQTAIIQIQTYSELNIVVICVNGLLGVSQIPSVISQVVDAPGFKPGMNSILDLRKVQFLVESKAIERVEKIFNSHSSERGSAFRAAFLVDDDFSFGICRMLAVELEQIPIFAKVVRTYDEAVEWVVTADEVDAPDASESA